MVSQHAALLSQLQFLQSVRSQPCVLHQRFRRLLKQSPKVRISEEVLGSPPARPLVLTTSGYFMIGLRLDLTLPYWIEHLVSFGSCRGCSRYWVNHCWQYLNLGLVKTTGQEHFLHLPRSCVLQSPSRSDTFSTIYDTHLCYNNIVHRAYVCTRYAFYWTRCTMSLLSVLFTSTLLMWPTVYHSPLR